MHLCGTQNLRVILIGVEVAEIKRPSVTYIIHLLCVRAFIKLIFVLDKLHCETLTLMPADMTVQQPNLKIKLLGS